PGVRESTTGETVRAPPGPPPLQRLAAQAARAPNRVCPTRAHLIEADCLREASRQTRKASAPGSDGGTAQTDAEPLDEHRRALPERLCRGRSQAGPGERVGIEKDEGGQRPIGTPAFEDKRVQRAVAMRWEAIDEHDFSDGSYGLRQGRSPHERHG